MDHWKSFLNAVAAGNSHAVRPRPPPIRILDDGVWQLRKNEAKEKAGGRLVVADVVREFEPNDKLTPTNYYIPDVRDHLMNNPVHIYKPDFDSADDPHARSLPAGLCQDSEGGLGFGLGPFILRFHLVHLHPSGPHGANWPPAPGAGEPPAANSVCRQATLQRTKGIKWTPPQKKAKARKAWEWAEEGVAGEGGSGLTKLSCVRVRAVLYRRQLPQGVPRR